MYLEGLTELHKRTKALEKRISGSLSLQSLNILAQISQNAFGKAYKVNLKSNKEAFILRVLSKTKLSSLKLTEKFRTEISFALAHKDDGILQVQASFEDKTNVYLLQESVDHSLSEKLVEAKKFSEADAAGLLKRIITTLIALFDKHEDVSAWDVTSDNLFYKGEAVKFVGFSWHVGAKLEEEVKASSAKLALSAPSSLGRSTEFTHREKLLVHKLGLIGRELLFGKPSSADAKSVKKRSKSPSSTALDEPEDFYGECWKNATQNARNVFEAMLSKNSNERPDIRLLPEFDFFNVREESPLPRNRGKKNSFSIELRENGSVVDESFEWKLTQNLSERDGEGNTHFVDLVQRLNDCEKRIENLSRQKKDEPDTVELSSPGPTSQRNAFQVLLGTHNTMVF